MVDSTGSSSYDVQLAIYDLSHGMARSLSSQFLGPNHAISIIPHTAILAYGREYYFGAGIASDDPQTFRRTRQMQPIEIQTLGRTRSSRVEFEAWCARVTRDGSYGPASYDLLRRNCNNFSHDAALEGLGLERGVPEWVLGVPERFLSSPMGQMVRPMLEQMQLTGPGPGNDGTVGSDFLAGVTAGAGGNAGGIGGSQQHRSVDPTPPVNPWAHLGTAPHSASPSRASKPDESAADERKPSAAVSQTNRIPSLLQHTRPLISNDTKMVDICVSKITTHDDDEQKKASITRLGEQLKKAISPLDEDAVDLLLSKWNKGTSVQALYTLMLLRLAVLHLPTNNSHIVQSIAATLTDTGDTDDRSHTLANNAPVRSMAWCVLSNALGSSARTQATTEPTVGDAAALEKLVDAALLDIVPGTQPRVEVRRSASAFLYNLIVPGGEVDVGGGGGADEIADIVVALLCGVTEGLDGEPDSTTRIRRTLVVGKILCPPANEGVGRGSGFGLNETAVRLVNNLGFADVFFTMSREAVDSSDDGKKLLVLVQEICSVLRSIT